MTNDSDLTKAIQPILQDLENQASNLLQKVKVVWGSDETAIDDNLIEQIISYLRTKKASIATSANNAELLEARGQFEVVKMRYESAIKTAKLKMCAKYGHYNVTTVKNFVPTRVHTYYGDEYNCELVHTCEYCGFTEYDTYQGTLGEIHFERKASPEELAEREALTQLDEAYKSLLNTYSSTIKQSSCNFNQWFEGFLNEIENLPRWIEFLEQRENNSANDD